MDGGYSGNESYKFVDKLLEAPGEKRIITPYIDAFYARKLLDASRKGRIWLITSSAPNNKEAMRLISRGRKHRLLLQSFYFLALAAILYVVGLHVVAEISCAIGIVLITVMVAMRTHSRGGQRGVEVKVIRSLFVHEKMYLGRDYAIVGSANLTYNGMHKNIEHIETISDAKKLHEMGAHFHKLMGIR